MPDIDKLKICIDCDSPLASGPSGRGQRSVRRSRFYAKKSIAEPATAIRAPMAARGLTRSLWMKTTIGRMKMGVSEQRV